jgi:ubiquinone/menaquinone biosynthesis methyltransferase
VTAAPIPEVAARRGEEASHGGAARGMFERIAPTYDLLNRLMSAGIDRRWRSRALEMTRSAPAGAALDLCAGTMDLTAMLAAGRPGERVVAVDFSPAMLDAGRRKAPGAEIVVADATALPFADATFAVALCGFGMRNLGDPVAGMREVLRVLRPGGVFVTLELFRPERLVTRVFHKAYAEVVLPAVGGLVSGDPAAYRYLARSMAGFLSRAEYERALVGAGFEQVTGDDLTLGIASVVRGVAPGSVPVVPGAPRRTAAS